MPIYKTARGRELDLGKLIGQNELTPAVGNMKVNARGDKLGPNGEIIERREEQPITGIPNQFNVRPVPETLAADPVPPVTKSQKKNVADQDPEGNE
jgi:hypothetical protein